MCPSFAPSAPFVLLPLQSLRDLFNLLHLLFSSAELTSAPNKGRKRTSSSGRKELQPAERARGRGEEEEKVAVAEKRGEFRSVKRIVEEPRRCLKLRGCFETSQFHSCRPGPVPEDSARFSDLTLSLPHPRPSFSPRATRWSRIFISTLSFNPSL